MTIAQALRRVKKLKGLMNELSARAASVVSYDRDHKPAFDFKATRAEIDRVRDELVMLEAAVAKANGSTNVEFEGKTTTLAEAIRRLQEFKAEMSWLSELSLREGTTRVPEQEWNDAAGRLVAKYRDVVHISDLKETERVAELAKLRDRFEALNDAVETANHRTAVELRTPAPAAA